MWSVDDAQACLLLLHQVAARVRPGEVQELHGCDAELLTHLRKLTAGDMHTLAAMRRPLIRVALDDKGLKVALRALEMKSAADALEAYFIHHGASPQMMYALFSLSFKSTYQRRRECGVPQPRARAMLPAGATCERIRRTWRTLADAPSRGAYYQLHQAYPQFSLAVLEAVVREEPA